MRIRNAFTSVLAACLMAASSMVHATDSTDTRGSYTPTVGSTRPTAVVIQQSHDGQTASPVNKADPLPTQLIDGSGNPQGTAGNPFRTSPSPSAVTGTDRGGTLTTGGVAQNAIAANSSRASWCVQNDPAATEYLYVREDGTASATTGAALAPGSQACSRNGQTSRGAISVFAATTGHRWYANEEQ